MRKWCECYLFAEFCFHSLQRESNPSCQHFTRRGASGWHGRAANTLPRAPSRGGWKLRAGAGAGRQNNAVGGPGAGAGWPGLPLAIVPPAQMCP